MEYTFKVVNYDQELEYEDKFRLIISDWDDFGNETTFNLEYFFQDRILYFGKIKILHVSNPITRDVIPKTFSDLNFNEFCSLGQSIDYYLHLKETFGDDFYIILKKLNDAIFNPGIRSQFEHLESFQHSLLRTSSAEKAFNEAKNYLSGEANQNLNFDFIYNTQLRGANSPHIIHFNFEKQHPLPSRIITLIGKNGSGKTQVLSRLALDLSGQIKDMQFREAFKGKRPPFNNVIAISSSIFDNFPRPKPEHSFSYKYCGFKNLNGSIFSQKRINENLLKDYQKINSSFLTRNRNKWFNILSELFDYEMIQQINRSFIEEDLELLNNFSSGQKFLLYIITSIVSEINSNSLLLFDEPENHLHPNAISKLIRSLDKLLLEFDSFAIIATHSPIVLQEVPSQFVKVFDREGNTPLIYNLGRESFGESIEYLTQEIFQTKDSEQNFKSFFKEMSDRYSYKEILSFFDDKLNPHAKSYLLSCYENPEKQLGDG